MIPVAAAWARGISLALTFAIFQEKTFAQGVIHTIPSQPLYYGDRAPSQDIDINNDGIPDFNLSTPDGLAIDLTPYNNNAIISDPAQPPDIGGFVYPLASGTVISSSLSPVLVWFDRTYPGGASTIVACANIGCLGYFQGSTDAYAGVRLESGGNYYYGWLHIQNFGLNFGKISEWAYESNPNTSIFAGAVPEPSTWAMLLLGAGLLAFRKR